MLKTRLITAFALLAVILPALFFAPAVVFQAIVLIALTLAAWEWGRMLAPAQATVIAVVFAILGGFVWYGFTAGAFQVQWMLWAISGFWLLYGPSWLHQSRSVKAGGVGVAGIILVGGLLAILLLHTKGVWYLISCLLIVWIADTGAYFSGKAFGKRKLAPSISPGKTREGAVGAVIAVLIYFVVVHLAYTNSNSFPAVLMRREGLVTGLVCAMLLTVASVVGDLIESKLKRECGVKDSGNTLPGHGGILDRVDALLPVLPLCALLS